MVIMNYDMFTHMYCKIAIRIIIVGVNGRGDKRGQLPPSDILLGWQKYPSAPSIISLDLI